MRSLYVIILAGGLGKRMKTNIPKVLNKVHGKPMIHRVIEEAIKIEPEKIIVVVGKNKEDIIKSVGDKKYKIEIEYVEQREALGTGHAIQCCKKYLEGDREILILSGDIPLIKVETLKEFINIEGRNKIMTIIMDEENMNGRILRDDKKRFKKIVEAKDCDEEEIKIMETNGGIYIFNSVKLRKYIMEIDNKNAQGEYYLPDVVNLIAKESEIKVYTVPKNKNIELININRKEELDYVNGLSI